MHAKQRNPSRIQAQEVAQKGPQCDAKVGLTRPSNPLKTLRPVCFIQRSNPDTLTAPSAAVQWTASEWQRLPRLA